MDTFQAPVLPLTLGLVILTWVVYRISRIGRRDVGLPPGPPTLPILGNIHQFPSQYAHLQFTEWARKYGGIMSLKIASQTLIILSSPSPIRALIDKGSGIVERPRIRLVEIALDNMNVALVRDGQIWRKMRRAMQMFLTRGALERYLPIQRAEAVQLMYYDTLKQPENICSHIERATTSVILSVAFGIRSPRKVEDDLVSEFHKTLRMWELLVQPGGHPPIDMIPILEHIPERWASWKTRCQEVKQRQQKLYFGLRDKCQERVNEDRRNGCFIEDLLDQQQKLGLNKELIGYIGGDCLEAGADTTSKYLSSFVLCIASHPEVQRRAQMDIDRVIDSDRVPSIDDIDNLPYVQAIIKEVHRYQPPLPFAIPHETTADELIEGLLIPKGSILFMNIYGLYRNPDFYDAPDQFQPERFMNSEFGTKPGADISTFRSDFHFGGGKRVCIGDQFAQNTIVINVLNLLWAFNFELDDLASRDKTTPLTVKDFAPGLVAGPQPFRCKIHPRSEVHASLIRSEYQQSRAVLRAFEQELTPEDAKFVEEW
ncbi:hypothetical protein QCA50_015162 [Cerrena zonata]|uniref:Cytochrome P450 n=1 Tax=Cerrena zonata TaxID=2478898 RepID=A0AAW0FSG6_9APHY